jgi:nitrogen-specific signal transduction histidine kinase
MHRENLKSDDQNMRRVIESTLKKILDATMLEAIIIVDKKGVLQYINQQALVFFETTQEELSKKPLLFSVSEGNTLKLQLPSNHKNKMDSMQVIEIDWGDKKVLLATFQDTTEQKKLEMQLLITDRMESLGTLIAGIAHEINNPLTIIVGNLDIVKNEIQQAQKNIDVVIERLNDAEKATGRILNIIKSLNVFSRFHKCEYGLYNINDILDSAIKMAWEEIRYKANLIKNYGHLKTVYLNEAQIFQVFFNLLLNAAQAIPEGNVTENEIKIVTQMTSRNKVSIEIIDSGPGIPVEVQHRMFTPFFTTKPVGNGTGLGLAICQKIIKSFEGEINFDSEMGKGTCFKVLLPAAVTNE